jgi:abequosyltransferase
MLEESAIINQLLLTIAVPTYNRARYLELCLERIYKEIANLSEAQRFLVKVYVSDNASQDDTSKIIAKYQELLAGRFEGWRNSDNIGPDYNFVQCYDSATTPYIWIIGDDDVLLSGGLKMVLDVLMAEDVDILYVNNYWFKDHYKEMPKTKGSHGVIRFRDSLEFTRATNVMLTFVSGLIVRSGAGLKFRSALDATNLVQLSWVLSLLDTGKSFAMIDNWVVAAKGSNSGGYELVKVFGNNLVKITNNMLKDKPDLARVIQNGTIVNFFPSFIMEFRKGSSNFSDLEMLGGLKDAFGNNWRYHIFLAPILVLPLFVARFYSQILKVTGRLLRFALI